MSIFDSGPHSRTLDLGAKIPSGRARRFWPLPPDGRNGSPWPRMAALSGAPAHDAPQDGLADVPGALPHDGRTFGLTTAVLPDTDGFLTLASAKDDVFSASCDIDAGPRWTAGTTLLPRRLAGSSLGNRVR
ncbi:hypothetical protein C8J57DRAFT_1505207 [Mycena rebaudengoi]|nr:hypothetical protein C8J57DRAFT_1505207 [Mycena rebaudengoi]